MIGKNLLNLWNLLKYAKIDRSELRVRECLIEDKVRIPNLNKKFNKLYPSKIDYTGKIVIIVGSEGKGIRHRIKKSCDFLTTIPMKGYINSLNVSAAVSAVQFERHRQMIQGSTNKQYIISSFILGRILISIRYEKLII